MKLYVRAVDVTLLVAISGVIWYTWQQATVWSRAAAVALALAAAIIAYVSSGPSEWLRTLHLGHNVSTGTSLRHARKVGSRLPCPYPDAWYAVSLSAELPPGCVKDVTVCNWNLIVWRPEATRENPHPAAVVMDAYCTHLGAHLALGGGRVSDQCIRCPFHGWEFGTDGRVRRVPGSDSVPPYSDLRTWPSQELNGVISVWMSSSIHKRQGMSRDAAKATDKPQLAEAQGTERAVAEEVQSAEKAVEHACGTTNGGSACTGRANGSAQTSAHGVTKGSNKPWFNIPALPELNGPNAYVYHGFTENIVNALLFEIPENGSDVAHLPILHRDFVVPSLSFALSHIWTANWQSNPDAQHVADINITETVALYNIPLPGQIRVKITQAGPSQVYLQMSTPMGPIVVVETVTPAAPMRLRVLHAVLAPAWVPSLFAKIVLYGTMVQFEKDVPVWCNKQYAPRPMLSKADPGIAMYRRWITQFWNPDSITFEEAVRQNVHDELGFPLDARMDW